MIKKILGILNIAAGAGILALLIQLWSRANISTAFIRPVTIIGPILVLLVAAASFISGIRVFKGNHWILAVICLILAVFVMFVILIAIALASFT